MNFQNTASIKRGGCYKKKKDSFDVYIALTVRSKGPCTKRLQRMYDKFYKQIEVDNLIAPKLGGYLASAGFDAIDQQTVAIPLGEWPKSSGKDKWWGLEAHI